MYGASDVAGLHDEIAGTKPDRRSDGDSRQPFDWDRHQGDICGVVPSEDSPAYLHPVGQLYDDCRHSLQQMVRGQDAARRVNDDPGAFASVADDAHDAVERELDDLGQRWRGHGGRRR